MAWNGRLKHQMTTATCGLAQLLPMQKIRDHPLKIRNQLGVIVVDCTLIENNNIG
jgi:hypothetical protein